MRADITGALLYRAVYRIVHLEGRTKRYLQYRKQHRELVRAHRRLVRNAKLVKDRYDAALSVLTGEQKLALRLARGERV